MRSDSLRACARKLISPRFYREGAKLLDSVQTIRRQGLKNYRLLHRPPGAGETHRRIHLKGFRYPVQFRPNATDAHVLIQNLVREEYGRFRFDEPPKTIVDAGAYIGDVSIYFLERFSNCQVIALEPDTESFLLASKNLTAFADRVTLFNQGLWCVDTALTLSGALTGATVTKADAGCKAVDCVSMTTLLNHCSVNQVDLVKLDIEGAEQQVLLNANDWLERTDRLIVEFHGNEIRDPCVRLLEERGFDWFQFRSLHYFEKARRG